jgi:hypothetical protein
MILNLTIEEVHGGSAAKGHSEAFTPGLGPSDASAKILGDLHDALTAADVTARQFIAPVSFARRPEVIWLC